MKYDIIIKNGRIVDPARQIDGVGNVAIHQGKIVETPCRGAELQAEQIIDAEGCLVLPGLIDYHAHVFYGGSLDGISADPAMLPQGVTTVVDGGSAGIANYEVFHGTAIANSVVRIKAYLNIAPTGIITGKLDENLDPVNFNQARIKQLFSKYPEELLGIKIRISKEVVKEFGIDPLKATLQIATEVACPVAVHTTNPPIASEELAELFRPGDVFSHMYHGKGSTIIGLDNKVLPAVKSARERGVIFDSCNGRNHFTFKTAKAALDDNFPPDVITSDLSSFTMYKAPVYGLPYIMSKYLNMGMTLFDVIAACTVTPAKHMGMLGEIGTLAAGACADIAIFRLLDTRVEFGDADGETVTGDQLLVPQVTVRAGQVVYRQIGF